MTPEEVLKKLTDWKEDVLKACKTAGADETTAKFNELAATLDQKIKDAVEAIAKKNPVFLGMQDSDIKKFSFGRTVKAMATNDWTKATYEQDVIKQTIEKSANAGSMTSGGILIPTEISRTIIDLAIPNVVMMGMGAQEMHDLVGEVLIPKITGRPSISWVGEEEAPTESNIALGEVSLNERTCAALTKISRQLLRQSDGVIDTLVKSELAKSFGVGIDDALLNSPGSSKKPTGIFQTAGMTSNNIAMGNNGKRFTMNEAGLMQMAVENANLFGGNPANYGYLFNPRVKWGMKLERIPQYSGQAGGNYAFNPLISDKILEEMLGFKFRTSTQISATESLGTSSTCSTVLFGDFSQIALGFWGTMEMRASEEAGNASGSAFTQRQVWITAFQSLDMVVKNALAFTKLAGCETLESNW